MRDKKTAEAPRDTDNRIRQFATPKVIKSDLNVAAMPHTWLCVTNEARTVDTKTNLDMGKTRSAMHSRAHFDACTHEEHMCPCMPMVHLCPCTPVPCRVCRSQPSAAHVRAAAINHLPFPFRGAGSSGGSPSRLASAADHSYVYGFTPHCRLSIICSI